VLAHAAGGGESVQDVAERMQRLITGLEDAHEGCHVLLVSHGDALSILASVLLGTDLRAHRQHGLPNCGVLRVPAE
jgi:broad specificity phosphatase PhoE